MPLVVHRNINFTSLRILLLLIAFLTGCREKGEQVRHVEVPATSQKTLSKLPESRPQRLQAASRLVETEAMDLAEPAIRSLLNHRATAGQS